MDWIPLVGPSSGAGGVESVIETRPNDNVPLILIIYWVFNARFASCTPASHWVAVFLLLF